MRPLTVPVICAVLLNICGAWGAETPTLERGRQLFTSKELGTSGMSCASCHPDGKGLKGIETAGDEQLTDTVNTCIAGPLKGIQLRQESSDMKSLLLYLKSFAGSNRQGERP